LVVKFSSFVISCEINNGPSYLVRYNNFALLNCLVQQWSMFTWLSFKLNVNDICVTETMDHVDIGCAQQNISCGRLV